MRERASSARSSSLPFGKGGGTRGLLTCPFLLAAPGAAAAHPAALPGSSAAAVGRTG